MRSIAVLKFPNLAQRCILDELDVEEVFYLSLLSKRAKQMASSAKRTIDSLTWQLAPGRQEIHLSTGLRFTVPMTELPEDPDIRMVAEWKLNGQLIPMYRAKYEMYIGDRSHSVEHHYELLNMVSKYILEVFRCREFELWTLTGSVPEDLFIFQYTRRFKTLALLGALLSVPIPAKDLKFVLEELEVRERLRVEPKVQGLQWSGPLRMNQLIAGRPEWLTFEALMSNECKVLKLHRHTFTSAQLNIFLKKWVTGGFPNLEYCSLMARDIQSVPSLLQGIETLPYNPANRPKRHPRQDWYLHQDVDIRRNDGVYGTIDVSDYRFILAVWINL